MQIINDQYVESGIQETKHVYGQTGVAFRMSPWPQAVRRLEDSSSYGPVYPPRYSSLPELARHFYGKIKVTPVSAQLPFFRRDLKTRFYQPGVEDPFVFKGNHSVTEFHEEAHAIVGLISDLFRQLGGKVKLDPDKKIILPDYDLATYVSDISSRPALAEAKAWLNSNADIARKFTIVREVNEAWWASSYAGKDTPHLSVFKRALDVMMKAIIIIEQSPAYKMRLRSLQSEAGDPLDTNVGYPLFSGNVDEAGRPISKYRIASMYENLRGVGSSWSVVKKDILERSSKLPLGEHLFATACIRRQQPGDKWAHKFKRTTQGLVTNLDYRGTNSVRIAWMSPYILNLLLTPLQIRWKALRYFLPGAYHDGETARARIDRSKKRGTFMIEADYSNYDRFIPQNLFGLFVQRYLARFRSKKYWSDMVKTINSEIPIIWPDYPQTDSQGQWGEGFVFTPSSLGLLSGLKITSEEGTIVNFMICLSALLDCGILNDKSALTYCTQYVNSKSGSLAEHFLVQSDDTLLMSKDPRKLEKMTESFSKMTKLAGLKGSYSVGDRFLMRHMSGGRDCPVPCRVWQNTLSNEDSYVDPLKFMVGLGSRTDGMLGIKSIDPFSTGEIQDISGAELIVSHRILTSLLKFCSTSAVKVSGAIELLNSLVRIAERMGDEGGLNLTSSGPYRTELLTASFRAHPTERKQVTDIRFKFVSELAARETSEYSKNFDAFLRNSMLGLLKKNSNIPSQQLILSELVDASPIIRDIIDKLQSREHQFFKTAIHMIGIDLDIQ